MDLRDTLNQAVELFARPAATTERQQSLFDAGPVPRPAKKPVETAKPSLLERIADEQQARRVEPLPGQQSLFTAAVDPRHVLGMVRSSPNQPQDRDWNSYAEKWGINEPFHRVKIPMDLIVDRNQRGSLRLSNHVDQNAIQEKIKSGNLNPVIVSQESNGGRPIVVDGTHSLHAAHGMGAKHVNAYVSATAAKSLGIPVGDDVEFSRDEIGPVEFAYRGILPQRPQWLPQRPERENKPVHKKLTVAPEPEKGGWKKVGGSSVYADEDGKILKGCPGLKGENIDDLINESDESRQEREARQTHAEAAGITGHDVNASEARQLGRSRRVIAMELAKAAAKRHEVATADVLREMPSAYQHLAHQYSQRELARQAARKKTGLNEKRINRLEDSGKDHASVVGFDDVAMSMAYEHPELGWNPQEANGGKLWELLKEPRDVIPPKLSQPVAELAAELIANAKRSRVQPQQPVQQKSEFDEWAPDPLAANPVGDAFESKTQPAPKLTRKQKHELAEVPFSRIDELWEIANRIGLTESELLSAISGLSGDRDAIRDRDGHVVGSIARKGDKLVIRDEKTHVVGTVTKSGGRMVFRSRDGHVGASIGEFSRKPAEGQKSFDFGNGPEVHEVDLPQHRAEPARRVQFKPRGDGMSDIHDVERDYKIGRPIPTHLSSRFVDELNGTLRHAPNSGHKTLDHVLSGKGKYIDKGNESAVYDAGNGTVVKAAVITPYHYTNGFRSPEEANAIIQDSVRQTQEMRRRGVPGILPQYHVSHEGRSFAVMPKVDTQSPMTAEHISQLEKTLKAMHDSGHLLRDQIQAGLDHAGRPVIYDVGSVSKIDPSSRYVEDDKNSDFQNLQRLAEKHGVKYATPRDREYANNRDLLEHEGLTVQSMDPNEARKKAAKLHSLHNHAASKDPDFEEWYGEDSRKAINRFRELAGLGPVEFSRPRNADGTFTNVLKHKIKTFLLTGGNRLLREIHEHTGHTEHDPFDLESNPTSLALKQLRDADEISSTTGHGEPSFYMTDDQRESFKSASECKTKHEFSSTHFCVDDAEGKLQKLVDSIDKKDLHPDECNDEFHVTIKYGIHTESPEEIKRAVAGFGPVKIRLGKTSIFADDGKKGYDVVKVEVSGDKLHQLNKIVKNCTECTDTYPTYKPHLTIAYVKSGTGEKYTGDDAVDGTELSFDHFVFSGKDGKTSKVPLVGPVEFARKPADGQTAFFWDDDEPKHDPEENNAELKQLRQIHGSDRHFKKVGNDWHIRAKKGGERSTVNNKWYKGGQWMPIHGLSEKKAPTLFKPEKPKPQSPTISHSSDRQPRQPMSQEEIEALRQKREDDAAWAEIQRSPLGRLLDLGDKPKYNQGTTPITDNWREYAERIGPDAMSELKEKLEKEVHDRIDSEWADHIKSESAMTDDEIRRRYGIHGSVKRASVDDAEWDKNQLKEFANSAIEWKPRTGKAIEKSVPGTHYVRELIGHILSNDKGLPIGEMKRIGELLAKHESATPMADPAAAKRAGYYPNKFPGVTSSGVKVKAGAGWVKKNQQTGKYETFTDDDVKSALSGPVEFGRFEPADEDHYVDVKKRNVEMRIKRPGETDENTWHPTEWTPHSDRWTRKIYRRDNVRIADIPVSMLHVNPAEVAEERQARLKSAGGSSDPVMVHAYDLHKKSNDGKHVYNITDGNNRVHFAVANGATHVPAFIHGEPDEIEEFHKAVGMHEAAPHDQIMGAIPQIEKDAHHGALVSARDLRNHTGLPKPVFDKAVFDLVRSGKLSPHHHDFATGLHPDKLAELVDTAHGDPERAGIHANQGRYWVGVALRPGPVEFSMGGLPEPHADNLSPEEDWNQNRHRSKAFKAWFGDWENEPHNASKVVHSETGEPTENHEIPGQGSHVQRAGKPIPVYHGTGKGGWTQFDKSYVAKATAGGSGDNLLYGPGFYFTEDPDVAADYSKIGDKDVFSTKSTRAELADHILKTKRSLEKEHALWKNAGMEADAGHYRSAISHLDGLHSLAHSDPRVSFEDNQDVLRAIHNYGLMANGTDNQVGDSPIQKSRSGEVKTVHLNIRKPFDIDGHTRLPMRIDSFKGMFGDKIGHRIWNEYGYTFHQNGDGTVGVPNSIVYSSLSGNGKSAANDWLSKNGYDGITHIGGSIMGDKQHRVWIAFEPHQIKSVNNRGTFDPSNHHMDFSRVGPVEFARRRTPSAGQGSFGWSDDEQLHPVESSNVYGYRFEPGGPGGGNLIVQYKNRQKDGPGPEYRYFTGGKNAYDMMNQNAKTGGSSGKFVWSNLRIRGTKSGHTVPYELAGTGPDKYIPRQAGLKRGHTGEWYNERRFQGQTSQLAPGPVRKSNGPIPGYNPSKLSITPNPSSPVATPRPQSSNSLLDKIRNLFRKRKPDDGQK